MHVTALVCILISIGYLVDRTHTFVKLHGFTNIKIYEAMHMNQCKVEVKSELIASHS